MIELFEQDIKDENRKSSKGNQLKWIRQRNWYKADYTGYEGLAEYMISRLLELSTLREDEFILYLTEEMKYKNTRYLGCRSFDFLPTGWQLLTLERLFQIHYGKSLSKSIFQIQDHKNRLQFLVEQIQNITHLHGFGSYMCKLLTVDTLFLNEDRHMHNIAVLLDEAGGFHYCPIFDNGASLLSDTLMDYPLEEDILPMMEEAKAKTFCTDFDEQLEVAEQLYGVQMHFQFTGKDVFGLLDEEPYYPKEIKDRVADIILQRMRKYSYLFETKKE